MTRELQSVLDEPVQLLRAIAQEAVDRHPSTRRRQVITLAPPAVRRPADASKEG